ncbi:MAG: acyl-CoA dehydrogenase, partial [Hoeflea sp.]
FSTDFGLVGGSLGVEVHGGLGFFVVTGAARLLRDARIAPIYEGTNGIQAIDLVMRKLPLSGGETVARLIADFRADAEAARASNAPALEGVAKRLDGAIDDLETATAYLQTAISEGRQTDALSGATPYLRLFGLTATAAMLARGALADMEAPEAGGRAALARFAALNLAPETAGLVASITTGADSLEAAKAALAS